MSRKYVKTNLFLIQLAKNINFIHVYIRHIMYLKRKTHSGKIGRKSYFGLKENSPTPRKSP